MTDRLRYSDPGARRESSGSSKDGIAIIGMACVFPQAPDLRTFWHNIVRKVDAISEAPPLWEAARYLESGRIKTSCGGFLKDLFRFDPREFGIMPNSLDGGEPDQFLALRVARDALVDAGYHGTGYDHVDTGIVLGHSTYLHRGQGTLIQNHIVVDQTLELLRAACPELDQERLDEVRTLLSRALPAPTADIAPGLVPNVMTGRIANRLNLKGPNYLVDGACSSSLLAVAAAMNELRAGRSRMMLAGGVNASLPAEVTVIFTQLGALSQRGKVRPFEAGSDGTLLGEGLGVVVLKRLEEALSDGDRVYAVLRGVGQASDGRGQGLLAPSVEGEALAIKRAYDESGIEPQSVGLVEAHGTGIPLGDKTEIAALTSVFAPVAGVPGTVALGSVKSMISHCIPAAGIAGLIKCALALHHKVLPPTLCDEVNPELGLQDTPFYINTEAQPWVHPESTPRRAGLNSFGFGGINTHAIVEEAPPGARAPAHSSPWLAELCIFSASDKPALIAALEVFARRLELHPEWPLPEIAAALTAADPQGSHRLAFVARDRQSLASSVEQALKRLRGSASERWATRAGIVYSSAPIGGQVAFLFPGEGSQYPGMCADLALCFPEVRHWLDFWGGLYDEPRGERRTDIVFPPASRVTPEQRALLERRLHDMDVGSEAIFIGGQALHSLLRGLGLHPDAMLGHSSGEFSALVASGAIPADDPAQLGHFIRDLNAVYRRSLEEGDIPTGALLAVGALPLHTVEEHLGAVDPEITIAMDNCQNQRVLYGAPASIATLQQRLTAAGGICMPLPFDRGYHTAAFAKVRDAFLEYYGRIGLEQPRLSVYSCASTAPYPDEATAARELAAQQWSSPVRFRETIQRMHADGVRTFIEVGPSGNLTAFINDILAGQDYLALATNLRRRSGVEQLLTVLAQLYVERRPVRLARLFESRSLSPLDLGAEAGAPTRDLVLDNTMPKVRLGEDALARLRSLTTAPAAAHLPADETTADMPPPADGRPAVAAEYFGLMRSFLEQQATVLARCQSSLRPLVASVTEAAEGAAASEPVSPTALVDSVLEWDERHVVALAHLGLQTHPFLRDHVLSGAVSDRDPDLTGLACVPLMVSLEIMAEACSLLAGGTDLQVIAHVEAQDWIALDDGEVTLEVRAEVKDAAAGWYRAVLMGASGTAVEAEFCFAQCESRCAPLEPLAEHRASVWNDGELYTCGMFHGPVFQSISHIEGWDDNGIDAKLSPVALAGFLVEDEPTALVTNPVLLDAMGQLAAYWIAQHVGTGFNCFPSTIERIELHAVCPQGLPGTRLLARQRPLGGAADVSAPRAWDFECLNSEGRPLVRVSNLVNIFFPVPPQFYEVRRDPLGRWLGHPTTLPGRPGVLLWKLALLPDEFCSQSGGIFLRILTHVFLGFEEREEWRSLAGNAPRRREWLLGRACIKEAVRYWIYQRTGRLLYPSDVTVLHDDLGAPHVTGWWEGTLADAPEISLSHDRFACLVAVAEPNARVGVDREEIGRVQRPQLVIDSLTPDEQVLVRGLDGADLQDRLLRIWCAKEAAAKCLGTGLGGVPGAFRVSLAEPDCAAARVEHARALIHVDLVRDSNSIIALASEPQQEIA